MAQDSKVIKKDLIADLSASSSLLSSGQTDHFLVEPEELDDRDDVEDRHVSVYFGTREPDVNVDARLPRWTLQEIIVQVYVQAHRLKDSEGSYEDLYDDLSDDVFDWIYDLADNNRVHNVNSQLRVPRSTEGMFFIVQEEPVRTNKSTYTRFRFNLVRIKSN